VSQLQSSQWPRLPLRAVAEHPLCRWPAVASTGGDCSRAGTERRIRSPPTRPRRAGRATAGWTSRSFAPTGSPTAPLVVNSVVFTVSTGSSPAVLWAFDGTTGKDLWNSGKTIAGALRGGGISIGNSQVYLGTVDGTLYAFGFPMEH